MMKVVFRVDSSQQIGTGHLIRCRTLAEELRRRDVEVQFICRNLPGNLIHLLSQAAFPVTVLPSPPATGKSNESIDLEENYAAWLGVSQDIDAAETIEALAGQKPDWLIVDHYGIDSQWERHLRPHVRQIMVLDDLANRPHDCDLLLDQNESVNGEIRYRELVPERCRLLVGSRYSLLRPEYAVYRQTQSPRTGEVRRVLVFFGGTDSQNMTGKTLEALSAPQFESLTVDVVVGATNPHRSEIEKQVAQRPHTVLYHSRPHLADLMAQADLAVGAGGTTTWERLCLGLPTLVVSIAENQVSACQALQRQGSIAYLGTAETVDVEQLRSSIDSLIQNPSHLMEMSAKARLQVDGLGAMRVAEALKPTSPSQLKLRLARSEDAPLYYDWVNEPEVRRQSLQTDPISWATHQAWFQKKLADPNCYMGVLDADGLPVGQIRFDLKGEEAIVDYSLDTLVRGRGWATQLVRLGMQLLRNTQATYLRADVKSQNTASRAVFLRLGFEEQSPPPPSVSSNERLSLSILSDNQSWLNDYLCDLVLGWLHDGHRVLWTHEVEELRPGDLCFYLSCGQIVSSEVLARFHNNLVVHESDLPNGKGWSPLTWQILEGKNRIPVTLFEAVDRVDSGDIYLQEWLEFEGHELIDELRQTQAEATLRLCREFVNRYPAVLQSAKPQVGKESFYPRRRPKDSKLDVNRSLAEQFDLLRVVDNEKYPAFFELYDRQYSLKVKLLENNK
ncbi:UDP-2,4-diacetamido-2,4,6-trideoxy-beta-L-altropyranose hydrolase [Baaleninema simplex]|uniref:UDP-2,4-diacetamido-2,4, 6-trideoxy-beta-L-altropyranose hydrolase n=1 Tax=Baaleninema simplex TaxID=2862350 RepID=UPI00034C1EF7|nr:UDP-2,4-diacetamido-2,4,6-trideoxy-beta-L-altropyranose hydrolase [Baaleninema simplex]